MFDNINLVQVVIQGGSVGVAVLALGILWQVIRTAMKLIGNHFVHFAELLTQVVEKLDRLIDATEKRPRE